MSAAAAGSGLGLDATLAKDPLSAFGQEPVDGAFAIVGRYLGQGYPTQFMGFVVAGNGYGVVDFHEEADVQVLMLRLAPVGGDAMDIDIEDIREQQVDPFRRQGCLLTTLLECHPQYVLIAVGVSARLKPLTELAVEHQQDRGATGVDDPGGTRNV